MPIVINEFEIMVEAPPESGSTGETPQSPAQQPQTLRPEDIVLVERRHRDRMERVRAD